MNTKHVDENVQNVLFCFPTYTKDIRIYISLSLYRCIHYNIIYIYRERERDPGFVDPNRISRSSWKPGSMSCICGPWDSRTLILSDLVKYFYFPGFRPWEPFNQLWVAILVNLQQEMRRMVHYEQKIIRSL